MRDETTTLPDEARGRGSRPRAGIVGACAKVTMVIERAPADGGGRGMRPEHGVVISRGMRVYLRTFDRGDLEHLASWVDDPFLERMVGSEFLHAFKHDWDKAPGFHDAVMNDTTQ